MSDLKSRLHDDLTAAMRAKDERTVGALRMALAAITVAEVAGDEKVELSDDQVLGVLTAEAKKRTESMEIYAGAGRAELAAREQGELEVFQRYLPAAMGDDELAGIVSEEVAAAAENGATGPKAMGQVIAAVRGRTGGRADGSTIARLVKAALTA